MPHFEKYLIKKEKVDIDGEKSAQITITGKEIEMPRRPLIMIMKSKQAVHHSPIFIFLFFCSYHATAILKKLKLCLLVVFILLQIKFVHTRISVPEFVIPI